MTQYEPDYVTPPGETLLDILDALGMTQAKLSEATEIPLATIKLILRGQEDITPAIAKELEKVLNVPTSFWIERNERYAEYLALQNRE